MKFDFRGVDEVQSYVFVPADKYLCRVAEVRPGTARDGSARWSYRLEVAEGAYFGRTAAWDSLTWSDRGVGRVKHVLQALGVDTHGVVEIEPLHLVGRRAWVQVQPEERENALTGMREVRNRVPYMGYEACDGARGVPAPDMVVVEDVGLQEGAHDDEADTYAAAQVFEARVEWGKAAGDGVTNTTELASAEPTTSEPKRKPGRPRKNPSPPAQPQAPTKPAVKAPAG